MTIAINFPPSSRSLSPSPSSSRSSSPPALDPNTLALLDAFLTTKADSERRFEELTTLRLSDLSLEDEELGDSPNDTEDAQTDENGSSHPKELSRAKTSSSNPMMDVDDYRLAFAEDWQLSQFWYTTEFATHLAELLQTLSPSKIAFVCCPTAYVAFQHLYPLPGARLLEYDQRFGVLAGKQYIHYDIEEPDNFPENIKGTFDVVVADPPFLNEVTNRKISHTLKQILHPTNGKLLLLTSTSVEDVLNDVYHEPPLGPLRMTKIKVKHGQLQNDFACWGNWEGAEEFGREGDA